MPFPCGGNAVQKENRKPRGPGTKEITHVSQKQTAKAFRENWAVYLHLLMCLLIKIVLGNFISQRLGHIFQLIMAGIRKLSADLAMIQPKWLCNSSTKTSAGNDNFGQLKKKIKWNSWFGLSNIMVRCAKLSVKSSNFIQAYKNIFMPKCDQRHKCFPWALSRLSA